MAAVLNFHNLLQWAAGKTVAWRNGRRRVAGCGRLCMRVGLAAGLWLMAAGAARAEFFIGDRVWQDMNGNGTREEGEPAAEGVRVELWNAAMTQLVFSTVTGSSGSYSLTGQTPGTYRVRMLLPSARDRFTVMNAGSDDTRDSDFYPSGNYAGYTDIITVPPDFAGTLHVDAGVILDLFRDSNIGDQVFVALPDGTQLSPPTRWTGSCRVELLNPAGAVVMSTQATPWGFYAFKAPPGRYRLKFGFPSGMIPSPNPRVGTDITRDSDIDADGYTAFFDLEAGAVRRDLDAGFVREVYLGNQIWDDFNGNGQQEEGEPGLEGRTVELWNAEKTRIYTSTRSGPEGHYRLVAPGPGSYRLRVLLHSGMGESFTIKNTGNDPNARSVINPFGEHAGFSDIYEVSQVLVSTSNLDAGIIPDPARRPFAIVGFQLLSGQIRLVFTGPAGRRYQVERSRDALTWDTAGESFVSTHPGTVRLVSSWQFGAPYRFYRVRRLAN